MRLLGGGGTAINLSPIASILARLEATLITVEKAGTPLKRQVVFNIGLENMTSVGGKKEVPAFLTWK